MIAIRTGLLFVPRIDENTSQRLRGVMHSSHSSFFVILERAAQSQRNWIEETLRQWSDEEELDAIFTIGGTLPAPGPSALEIVPEATNAVLERALPSLPETMRALAYEQSELALLDRGTAGIRGRTLIVNLPAGADAAAIFLQSIIRSIEPICLHLREDSQAPQLADAMAITDVFAPAGDDSLPVDDAASNAEDMSVPPTASRLDAQEFAAFLQRSPGEIE